MIVVVMAQWFVSASAPAIVAGFLEVPRRWETVLLIACTAYCYWTGWRAMRRGWTARFVLRLAIPAGLFVMSALLAMTCFHQKLKYNLHLH